MLRVHRAEKTTLVRQCPRPELTAQRSVGAEHVWQRRRRRRTRLRATATPVAAILARDFRHSSLDAVARENLPKSGQPVRALVDPHPQQCPSSHRSIKQGTRCRRRLIEMTFSRWDDAIFPGALSAGWVARSAGSSRRVNLIQGCATSRIRPFQVSPCRRWHRR